MNYETTYEYRERIKLRVLGGTIPPGMILLPMNEKSLRGGIDESGKR